MKYNHNDKLPSIFKEAMEYFQNHHYINKSNSIDAIPRGFKLNNKLVSVYSPFDARVISARDFSEGAAGKQVYLESLEVNKEGHPKWCLYMCHFLDVAVSTGDKVTTGFPLGLMGDTGNCKGHFPHVHLRMGFYCRAGKNEIGCMSFNDLIDVFDMTLTPHKYY